MEVTQDSRDRDTITNGFTMQGIQFTPPTPPSSSSGEFNFFFKVCHPTTVWDMEKMYGATKGPYQYLGAVGTIELDDFIQEFDS
jgi:hypothetical protein